MKDKIRFLQEVKSIIYLETIEYFLYYFNNIVRNKVEHGRNLVILDDGIQDDIFSKELILDMIYCKKMLFSWINRFYSSQGIELMKLIKAEKHTLPKAILEGYLIYIPSKIFITQPLYF